MKHCLIVDDSDVIRKITRTILERMGWKVTEAASGTEAIEKCAALQPSLVLLDWQMPEMSGQEVLAKLRSIGLSRRPHVVYCTTENDTDDIMRALTFGAADYVIKPFTREMLQDLVAAVPMSAAA